MSFFLSPASDQPGQNEESESISCDNDHDEEPPSSTLTTTSEKESILSKEESKENVIKSPTGESENVINADINQSIDESAPILSTGSLLTNSTLFESFLLNKELGNLDNVNLQVEPAERDRAVDNVNFQICDDDNLLFKITNESSAAINNYKNKSKNEIGRSSRLPSSTIGQNYSPFFDSSERSPIIMESSIYNSNNNTRSLTNFKQRNSGGYNEFNDEIIRKRRSMNRDMIDYDGGDEAEDEDFKSTWPCSKCTFFNSLNSNKCIQCDTPRKNQIKQDHFSSSIMFHSGSDIEEIDKRLNPLKIVDLEKKSGDKLASMNINRAINSRTNVPAYTTRTSASHVGSYNDKLFKWACPLCTYENFEKSLKCVMCLSCKPDDFITTNQHDQQMFEPSLINNSISTIDNRRNYKPETQTGSPLSLSLTIENENNEENSFRNLRRRKEREIDERWLDACRGVVDGDYNSVELYLLEGGSPARALTENEIKILNRPSAFDDAGITLIHLALRFHQENMLAILLSAVEQQQSGTTQSGKKLVPSYAAPDIADRICRTFVSSIRQRKGPFRCNFTCENVIFTLPSEIEDLTPDVQETLFDEILDREVQKELENSHIINWCAELTDQLNSRLYALWNRTSGDCLLDSVLGAIWGIFDRKNDLRNLLADSLHDCSSMFYQRWKENELCHARLYNFSLNDNNLMTDWSKLLSIAGQPGSSLEQLHIFALAHIIRRPIIVYGVKYVKNYIGENLGYAKYEGVYLPLLWEPSFCFKSPISIGYTRGHFSALVPMETEQHCDPLRATSNLDATEEAIYLPIITYDGSVLPVHFLCQSELGKEEKILSQWLDLCFTETGVMVVRQIISKRPPLLSQMLEEWLMHYRGFSNQISSNRPYVRPTKTYISSDGESD